MKHLYIFNNLSRGLQYGVGSYLEQLIKSLDDLDQIRITCVNSMSTDKSIRILEIDKIRYIQIPIQPSATLEQLERYDEAIIYILASYIDENEKNMFLLNFWLNSNVFSLLKELYPSASIYLVIHYFKWCFALQGDEEKFQQILIKKAKEEQE